MDKKAVEWIRKQWYIYTMEYYSAIKKNTFESEFAFNQKLILIQDLLSTVAVTVDPGEAVI